jgi:hypothetical protein
MKLTKRTVLLGFIIFLGVVYALPVTRDELDWHWADANDQAVDFMRYYTEWPHGRHAAEAHRRYDQRAWEDTKKAMIREAYKQNAQTRTNTTSIEEKQARMEQFFWKEVSNANTVDSYLDYLNRYPHGRFASQARQRMATLNLHPPATAVIPAADSQ